MANQWGRENGSVSDRAGGRFAMVVAAIVLFAAGVGGGYGAYRLAGPNTEAALAELRSEVDRLQRQNETALDDLEAREAELREAREKLAGQGSVEQELRATITRQSSDLDRLTKEVARANVERQALEQRLKAAQRNSGQQADLAAEVARLSRANAQLDAERRDLAEKLATTAGELTRLNRQNQQLSASARELQAAQAKFERTIADLRQRLAEADNRIARLQQQVRDLSETRGEPPRPEPRPPARDPADEERPARPRPPAAVDAALDKATGLDRLSAADRRQLRRLLISGECVSTALDAVFDRVPVVSMRNLIRDLRSDC